MDVDGIQQPRKTDKDRIRSLAQISIDEVRKRPEEEERRRRIDS